MKYTDKATNINNLESLTEYTYLDKSSLEWVFVEDDFEISDKQINRVVVFSDLKEFKEAYKLFSKNYQRLHEIFPVMSAKDLERYTFPHPKTMP